MSDTLHPPTAVRARRFEPLLDVRHYAHGTYRFATGHPRAGEVSRVERYCRSIDAYVWDNERQCVRVG